MKSRPNIDQKVFFRYHPSGIGWGKVAAFDIFGVMIRRDDTEARPVTTTRPRIISRPLEDIYETRAEVNAASAKRYITRKS